MERLGYTQKWLEYNFLNKKILTAQLAEFEKADEQNTAHYRYTSFVNWLEGKKKLTDKEVNNYIHLAKEDTDERMAGSAITDLFVSTKISDKQFETIESRLPEFGEWTKKLITREVLIRRVNKEKLTMELFQLCFKYKNEFNDNRLLISIIKQTNDVEFLSLFSEIKIGKKIKTLASNKLNQIINGSKEA